MKYPHYRRVNGRDKVGKVISVANDVGVNQNEKNEPFQRNENFKKNLSKNITKSRILIFY